VVRENVRFLFSCSRELYVYREFCVIAAEGNWYMDGKEWILTAADGHLALLANECHPNSYQQVPI